MKIRYFANEECQEMVYTLDYFEGTIDEDLKEIELLEMKREYGWEMWCKENQRECPIEKGDCGFDCPGYDPCNHIKGRCRYLDNCFVETGRKFTLTRFGLKEVI